jgi:hypothetical protein
LLQQRPAEHELRVPDLVDEVDSRPARPLQR